MKKKKEMTVKKGITIGVIGVISFLLLLLLVFGLTGLSNYYKEKWHITNQALFEEYFPKYIDYAEQVVDSYDYEYQKIIKTYPSSLHVEFEFEDGYSLEFSYSNRDTWGKFTSRLTSTLESREDAMNANHKYFEMMHEVHKFSVYKLKCNDYTFLAYQKEILESNDKDHLSNIYHFDHITGNIGYGVSIKKDNNGIWHDSYGLEAVLTDKNIWNEENT